MTSTLNSSNPGEGSAGEEGGKGGATTPGGVSRNVKSSTPGADESGKVIIWFFWAEYRILLMEHK